MKELSKEIINIDGKDYTLFLNRLGITAWEKYVEKQREQINEVKQKYSKIIKNEVNDENPFDGIEDYENLENDVEFTFKLYKRLYWIMLYTEHKFNYEEADKLMDKAREEYGVEQLIELCSQMLEDVNTNPNKEQELKKLTALKPKKNK